MVTQGTGSQQNTGGFWEVQGVGAQPGLVGWEEESQEGWTPAVTQNPLNFLTGSFPGGRKHNKLRKEAISNPFVF